MENNVPNTKSTFRVVLLKGNFLKYLKKRISKDQLIVKNTLAPKIQIIEAMNENSLELVDEIKYARKTPRSRLKL